MLEIDLDGIIQDRHYQFGRGVIKEIKVPQILFEVAGGASTTNW